MKIIAIANQKGGVGKTTAALNLAAGLDAWSCVYATVASGTDNLIAEPLGW